MAIIEQQTHTAAEYKMLSILSPASGGLNIQDLEYTLPVNQSPNIVNMMYKNGVFGKRYGQTHISTDEIPSCSSYIKYNDSIYGIEDTETDRRIILINGTDFSVKTLYTIPQSISGGVFFIFAQDLYFLASGLMLKIDNLTPETCSEIEPYTPQIMLNCTPAGTGGSVSPYAYNLLGTKYQIGFRGDGTTKTYVIPTEAQQTDSSGALIPIDSDVKVVAKVGTTTMTEGSGFSVNRNTYTITFDTAPAKGTNDNVWITISVTNTEYTNIVEKCKYWSAYGGGNNTHIFLSGNGTSRIYYSDTADPTYFPETNWMRIGNTEDDITGLGLQYDKLIIFKPTEIFEAEYQFGTDSSGTERYYFNTKSVNNAIGCDCPDTIQLIDSRLTWLNSEYGVCTLCSSLIEDERNVRPISRNINGGYRQTGILSETNIQKALSIDFDGKYIIFTGTHAWMWDYYTAPYTDTSSKYSLDELAKNTAWYYWEEIGNYGDQKNGVKFICFISGTMYYITKNITSDVLCKFDNTLDDFGNSIHAIYQTPMFDGNNFECLKTVKKMFTEVRADTACNTAITYLTDETPTGEVEPEPITIGTAIWDNFSWKNFAWTIQYFAKTFTRKCSLKKIELWGTIFENDDRGSDMNISSIKYEYTIVKEIK